MMKKMTIFIFIHDDSLRHFVFRAPSSTIKMTFSSFFYDAKDKKMTFVFISIKMTIKMTIILSSFFMMLIYFDDIFHDIHFCAPMPEMIKMFLPKDDVYLKTIFLLRCLR